MKLTPEARALLDKHALQLRAEILFDLALAATVIEATYDPEDWDPGPAGQALADFHGRLKALLSGLGTPWA